MEGIDTTPSKIDLRYAEQTVVFTISDCSLDKKYSFYTLTKEEAGRFLSCLKHLEEMSWSMLAGLDRKHGLTVEKETSDSYEMIDAQNMSGQITEKYYYHLRVEQTGKFRVFGYQQGRFFCITHIDKGGIIHHT